MKTREEAMHDPQKGERWRKDGYDIFIRRNRGGMRLEFFMAVTPPEHVLKFNVSMASFRRWCQTAEYLGNEREKNGK